MTTDMQCARCGACCDRPGFVHITAAEIKQIARYLALTEREFIQRYTRLTDDRKSLSLIDSPCGSCAFLDKNNQCRIHKVKPRQCADFPRRWRYAGYEKFCALGRAWRSKLNP